MRPHVEIIDEKDLIAHPAELPGGIGDVTQRNLSYDEEDGSVSARLSFATDWSRPAGVHNASTEWFVISGSMTLGDETFGEGGYWHAPAGLLTPPLTVAAGTEVLYFRDYGDWGFEITDRSRDGIAADAEITITHSGDMEWIPVEIGSPMRFDLGGTPVPGLFIKMLWRNPDTGFYSRLIKTAPGWREEPLAHHPVMEEAYCLDGGFDYNWGHMDPGTYFYRPALIRHGDFTAHETDGCTWLVRCDGDLVDWYTENSSLEMHGDGTNWGPEYPHTLEPRLSLPVRSRSVEPMGDPYYQ